MITAKAVSYGIAKKDQPEVTCDYIEVEVEGGKIQISVSTSGRLSIRCDQHIVVRAMANNLIHVASSST